MSKNNTKNTPVYFFLGFRLLEATYKRTSDAPLESFGVKLLNSTLHEKTRTYILVVQFDMRFENGDESSFVFNGGYEVNDFKWYEQMKKEQIDALFFSVMFPYIREKIHSLSNDYRGSIHIPIIDLRHADLTEGATFKRNKSI